MESFPPGQADALAGVGLTAAVLEAGAGVGAVGTPVSVLAAHLMGLVETINFTENILRVLSCPNNSIKFGLSRNQTKGYKLLHKHTRTKLFPVNIRRVISHPPTCIRGLVNF